ncbi:UDP-N-acetylglucosamine 1-carboxyvinyltransferase [Candidatus Microgenomates bacterium]|nr:UDP-N-acetylglucosamine 1-carboxyvinyltransferase [Candidatus Microgenomates bacterium]
MTGQLIITGGRPLEGEVAASGAKNSVTKLMIASLLTNEPVVLYNVPRIGDVDITREICEQIGSQVTQEDHTLTLHAPSVAATQVKEQTSKNRLSVLAIAPLLHRAGEAKLPVVGGDRIGARPVNYHIEALRRMGAEIQETPEGYRATASKLHGTPVSLPYPSVGATENILLTAVLAKGRTEIRNAATEPEVTELVMLLQRMGAIIEFGANRLIIIDGVDRLHGTAYTVMNDRLETASYGMLALATGGKITVTNSHQTHLVTFLNAVRRMGADYRITDRAITFSRARRQLKAITVTTAVWPGFSSDWQQPLGVLLTQATGRSVIHETVYEHRFEYTKTLNRMGAQIEIFDARKQDPGLITEFAGTHYDQSAAITGPTALHGTEIEIPDIRAGMAYIIAALTAQGTSTITGIEHLLRGYEDPLSKLKAVGADFKAES